MEVFEAVVVKPRQMLVQPLQVLCGALGMLSLLLDGPRRATVLQRFQLVAQGVAFFLIGAR